MMLSEISHVGIPQIIVLDARITDFSQHTNEILYIFRAVTPFPLLSVEIERIVWLIKRIT